VVCNVKNSGNPDFRPCRLDSAAGRQPVGVAKGRQIEVAAVSPAKNTNKTAPLKAELGGTPGFSTAFSTVVEILGEKPKVSLPDDDIGGFGTRDCSTRIWDPGFVIGLFKSVQYY
jgi:hypothetical protein